MTQEDSFQRLKSLTDSNSLSITQIIAPPRSCSTVLERALSNSPSIDIQINDPWALDDSESREATAYNYILSRVQEVKDQDTIHVVIKNVADYILPGEMYERWLSLCKNSVFLVRSPELTMHSLLNMVFQELEAQRHPKPHPEDLILDFFRNSEAIQNSKLYRDSLSMIAEAVYETKPSEKWLEAMLNVRIAGWNATFEHLHATIKYPEHPVAYVDATILLAAPFLQLQKICSMLNLEFKKTMISWGDQDDFTSDYEGDIDYYATVVNSSSINTLAAPPSDVFASLPQFLLKHLQGRFGALEIHKTLLEKTIGQFTDSELIKLDAIMNEQHDRKLLDQTFIQHYKNIRGAI